MCVRERERESECMKVRVCEREGERQREREGEREKESGKEDISSRKYYCNFIQQHIYSNSLNGKLILLETVNWESTTMNGK